MHVIAMNSLLTASRYAFESLPREQSSQVLCFIIDRGRQPDAMSRLYRIGEPMNAQALFSSTEFAQIANEGPLWLTAPWGSRLAAEASRLCEENHSGIALTSEDATEALAHARWLLKANDGSGGQSLLSYHKPSLWAALTYTAAETSVQLFGPWLAVYSPAPIHFGKERGTWLSWTVNSELKWLGDSAAFNLPDNAAQIQARLGWLYWVDEQYAAFGKPDNDRINEITENLDLLVKNNIYEGDHLLKLASVVDGPLLEARPEAMAILQSREESFIKVEQLMQIASANPQ
jgi:hypothetical protein